MTSLAVKSIRLIKELNRYVTEILAVLKYSNC